MGAKMEREYKIIGKNVRKRDALAKATGEAIFATDITLPGMLYAKVLRSPYPHAKIKKIDVSKAEQLPGVKAVSYHANVPKIKFNTSNASVASLAGRPPVWDRYIFDDVVRHVGDEVAAVAATSEKIAREALKLIEVEYEQLPAVFDVLEAMKEDAPDIHEDCQAGKNIPGGIINVNIGDVEKGFAESDLVIEERFKLPIAKHIQLETHAAVAAVDPDNNITVWSPTQTPHPVRTIIANSFDLPQSKVRVLNPPYIGGAFGVRGGTSAKAEHIAVDLALKARRPVKVVYTREEDIIASDTRHSGYVWYKLGVKKDGTFHAMEVKGALSCGAYNSHGGGAVGLMGLMVLSVYRAPHQKYVGHCVYTNCTSCGAMRGYGNPQGVFVQESVVDMAAEKLGMDPLELRLKNITKVGDPWCLDYPCGSTALDECIKKGAESIGWQRRGKLNKPGTTKVRGIGVGVGSHISNTWSLCSDYDSAYVVIQQDGSVLVAAGVSDMGTGTSTTLPQLAAEALGAKLDVVNITFGDTLSTPFTCGCYASRTLYTAGTAVVAAARDAKRQVLEYAGQILNLPAAALEMEGSEIFVAEGMRKGLTLEEVAYHAHQHNQQFIGVGRSGISNSPPWEAHFAEVEVDLETGQVEVIKLVGVHDIGRPIHPAICEGQIEGGLLMGMGYATNEEIRYNDEGKQQNNSIGKYFLPTAEDVPEIETILIEDSRDPLGPFGAKGAGETGCVPTAGAIANAIYNATGIRFTEIPITAERMLSALEKNKAT